MSTSMRTLAPLAVLLLSLFLLHDNELDAQTPFPLTDLFVNGTGGYPQYRIPSLLYT